jgi:hypothetical protein
MQLAYAAIGRAVLAAQIFETALIPIFEFFKMQSEPGYLEKTGGYIPAGSFKVPVKSIVNALAAKGSIAEDLEDRLSKYIDDRNTLIHRWVQEHGWPDDNDEEGFAPIVELAGRVELEAKQLTRSFAGYMVKFANPDWAAQHGDEYKDRMAQLFHRAHIDG